MIRLRAFAARWPLAIGVGLALLYVAGWCLACEAYLYFWGNP